MSQQFIDDVLAACKTGAGESASALGRALGAEIQLALGDQGDLQTSAASLSLDGKGLLVSLPADKTNAVLTVPAASGLVPDWCEKPDATGLSRLATLALELGMTLLPETWQTNDFRACWVDNMAEALLRGGVPQDAAVVRLIASGASLPAVTLGLVWPVSAPEKLFAFEAKSPETKSNETKSPEVKSNEPDGELIGQPAKKRPTLSLRSSDLPSFTRSLLRIKVPVVVTLAEKRQKLSRIVELGPGAIIQFDKSCEEMLELEVGNQQVALGEAVKVGDKFGLRITSVALPDERFNPWKPEKPQEAAC